MIIKTFICNCDVSYITGTPTKELLNAEKLKDMQAIEDNALAEALERVKDANKAADAAQPTTTTPKPAATSSGASVGSSSPSAPVKSNTYTVNVNLAGKTTPINAASDADARKLIGLLQDLEARA